MYHHYRHHQQPVHFKTNLYVRDRRVELKGWGERKKELIIETNETGEG
jgi:hypothetical protein